MFDAQFLSIVFQRLSLYIYAAIFHKHKSHIHTIPLQKCIIISIA